jgi:hypothetical protein
MRNCFLYIFFEILYIFYNTVFIPAVVQGWAQLCWVVTPAPGLHGGGVTGWESNPGLEINSHQVRIEPRTGLQQSSVLTTELRRTPTWGIVSTLWKHTTWHENEHTIITVHTWTAIFLEHLANTSFMASSQASRLKLSPFLASPSEHASGCHVQPSILLFISVGRVSHLTPSCYLGSFSLIHK